MELWSTTDKIVLPICLLISIAISVLLGFLLKDKPNKVKEIPRTIIAVFLVLFEIFKIIYHLVKGTFELRFIPLHFCSTFLFWFPLSAFGKGFIKKLGDFAGFTASIMFVIIFYIAPSFIIGDATSGFFDNFYNFHTLIFHNVVVLYFALTITLKLYKPSYKDFKYVIIAFTIYFLIAVPSAHLLNTNFTNLLRSEVPFIRKFINTYGHAIYTPLVYVFGITYTAICFYSSCFIYSFIKKKKVK